MEIMDDYVRKVCKLGQGENACSFLMPYLDIFECAKGTVAERLINKRREEGRIKAKGDNCEGYNEIFSSSAH